MNVTDYAIKQIIFSGWINKQNNRSPVQAEKRSSNWDLLQPVRQWLTKVKITEPKIAHHICRLIPSQCPFSRKIKLLGRTILTIPPLCKLNPLYDELMELRFRAMCYLVDDCGEDISKYC